MLYRMFKIMVCCLALKSGVSKSITRLFGSKKAYNQDLISTTKFYKPKSQNQQFYNNYLNDDQYKILFAVGPAGTGKTLLACNTAIRDLKKGKYQKIIITRPVVPVEEDIGFLPGNLIKKMDPWTRPIFDIFLEFYSQKEIDNMMHANVIEISPLAYMRGRTFKNALIIADEMQNSSPNQMLMLTTRIGVGSKMVITGDINQTDRRLTSGLEDFINKYKLYKKSNVNENGIEIIELDKKDILREPIISTVLDIYNVEKLSKINIVDSEIARIEDDFFYENVEVFNNDFIKCNINVCECVSECEIEKEKEKNKSLEYSDAALMPKKDISNNYDF